MGGLHRHGLQKHPPNVELHRGKQQLLERLPFANPWTAKGAPGQSPPPSLSAPPRPEIQQRIAEEVDRVLPDGEEPMLDKAPGEARGCAVNPSIKILSRS